MSSAATSKVELFKPRADAKTTKPFPSPDGRSSSQSTEPRILQRLAPAARRVTFQFESTPTDTPSPTSAIDFTEQNDRDFEAECDRLIEYAIREEWMKAGFTRFRKLRIEVCSGNVNLQGRLDSFYQKQMAQSLVRRIRGVRSIENDIQVKTDSSASRDA